MNSAKHQIILFLHIFGLISGLIICIKTQDPVIEKLMLSLLILLSLHLIKYLQKLT